MKITKKALSLWVMLLLLAGGITMAEVRTSQSIVEDMVVYYAAYGADADPQIVALLAELTAADPAAGDRWTRIMSLWRNMQADMAITPDVLPDGLPQTDELCMVVLGFQLNPDGSMKPELIQRLNVALASASKYPNALIACTGGGTAANDPTATEAGAMAAWLVEQGISADRIMVEDQSLTTAQNAMFTLQMLAEQYPQVTQLAIISSDYHITTGTLLFNAQAILLADDPGAPRWTVTANAAWPAPTGTLSPMFQAGALIELSGDVATAFSIYYDTYTIHELPPIK